MANSGFAMRKQELEYDRSLLSICELISFKVMELVRIMDVERVDFDESTASTLPHVQWTIKFFEQFKKVY